MGYRTIAVTVDGPVATVTLNRPEKRNAISAELRDELEAAFAALKPGDDVRVIRLRGAGAGFCSGYDLTSTASVYSGVADAAPPRAGGDRPAPAGLGESAAVRDRERLRESIERWLFLWQYRKPVVAQVHGICLAGGLDLLGVCDLAYAADDALFGHPAARGLGIPPTLGMLPMRIGAARTKELLFTGDPIDAHEAYRIGLVNKVLPPDELDARTMALCRRIAHTPLDALTLHKHVVNRWSEVMGLREAALAGAEFDALFHLTAASAEFGRIVKAEGVRAALAWRDADFDADPPR
ncbi:enoyl-CoA hydratase-related protein [Phytohabitans sp. ZYX-F-186]|uniref:Enoyl-CoA hydratase-related protein n=1 Tax=Phytohabitans maris TaxID=3071409 RepID=A0ABU0ZW55_9ACTN|nr:enoyl-CoA hydratase-related protein [Phytohabitans sp. ZYX-F-186]MDQ7911265.1 enoyl-CoA hydratase-related protein [Phytohabitans sp. ZYX-F-186]